MKPLHLAKARLRPGLDDAARQRLAAAMLTHVLTTVRASGAAEVCGVVSADPDVLALAAEHGCEAITEPEPGGYNAAASRASVWAQQRNCDALLILPADLPLLTPEDIHNLTRLADARPQVVIIAPDAREEGTNALLLRPPDIIPPSFGPDSFRRHYHLARQMGVSPVIYHSPDISNDIDHPTDLIILKKKLP
jgi:2-phospho-L-lactate guanylyltransferase